MNRLHGKLILPIVVSFAAIGCLLSCDQKETNGMIVFQSDFGLKDGAVSEMKGVALSVNPYLKLYDITHEIPSYSVWDASYRLNQTYKYWPSKTVFVSVVDPGVGSERLSVVAKMKNGSYIVTPDNGTLTFLANEIDTIRVIDESKNRRPGSEGSSTFHGRDVYAYCAAKLATGIIDYNGVGEVSKKDPVVLEYTKPSLDANGLKGTIEILDSQYGNVWTNIGEDLVEKYNMKFGDTYTVNIENNGENKYSKTIKYVKTFSDVAKDEDLIYINSLGKVALAKNQGNFAKDNGISYGNNWSITLKKYS